MPRKRHSTQGSSPSAGEHSNSWLASQGELLQSGEGHDLKMLKPHFIGNTQIVRQCSKCPDGAEYYCVSCPCDLCHQCKENHVMHLNTIDHDVVKYHEKYNKNQNHEISVRHNHSSHRTGQMDISSLNVRGETPQEIQRQIHHIKNNRLFYMPFLLKRIKADVKICHTEFSDLKSQMLEKVEKLKNRIDCDLRDVDYKHECLKQKIQQRLFSIQTYEHKYEHSAISLLQFFSFIKKSLFTQIHLYARTMTKKLNKRNVMGSLLKIQIMERRKRCTEIECLLTQMSGTELQQTFSKQKQQCMGTINTVRSKALFYRPLLLTGITSDFKTCHTEFSDLKSQMLTKAKRLNYLIDYVLYDLLNNVFCAFDFKHRCLKQKLEMIRHIASLRRYELRYVQPAFTFSALQFLSFIKKALPQINLTLHTNPLSMTESPNTVDVLESLKAILITERGKRRVGNQCLLKLMSGAEFHQSLTLTGVYGCYHISCVTSDRIWVSDNEDNLILTDTTGVPLHRVEDPCSGLYKGFHTVSSESELIYIDRNYNINKLSTDMKTTTTFTETTHSTWRPQCVYWSPSTGDLLVAMWSFGTKTGNVTRYNQSGQLTQTIQHNNSGRGLYREPNYITENNNGDVVVSDYDYESGAVVVTECGGRHRFSYTGRPSGSGLRPCGICTDALSHILVCDGITETVQMIDRDGQFLSHLLIRPSGIFSPQSLSYDVNTHRLWVGSDVNNTVVIYRYITRQDTLTDLTPATADVMESLSEIQNAWTEKPQQGNQCLLRLMSPPKLLHYLTVTGVDRCLHISCVTSDRVWVSDKNKLMLTDTTGVHLHRVEDSCRGNKRGLHTVNSESELIYIDRNYNITKLSKDMKTNTTFIERTDSTWRPRCVYWSPSTGDLLVGMSNYKTKTGKVTRYNQTGKVTRYNQSGQLTQTIQNDNTRQGLYREPNYITENNNGDIVVSDDDAVVVTERGGRHRFSYTGHPSGSQLEPCGICTDALSHILVCDGITKTVQMIDRDGQFLLHLLIRPSKIFSPQSLSYDVNTHRLWVGSDDNNTVVIYRYITRQDALTDEHRPRPDEDPMSSSTPAI